MRNKTLVIAGGGTGGHVLAGIAVADAWRAIHGPEARVLFVGSRGGIEEKLVPRAKYPLEVLQIGSLNRVSFGRKLKTLAQLPLSFLKSAQILIREKPRAALGVGGYSSGPVLLMARLLGVKTAILEQNAVPGITNRILGRWVHQIFSAFPGLESHFGSKVRVTGNPVRDSMKPMESASRNPMTVFIFGGSQGAMGVNTLVIEALPLLKDLLSSLRFIHQTGEKDFERVQKKHREFGANSRVDKFIYDMPECYRAASLVISRSGSSTLAELAAVKRACVLVPFPQASDNHQEKNARLFVDQGAAKLLLQKDSRGEDLAQIIREFHSRSQALTEMENAIAHFYRPNAAKDIASSL